MDASSGRRSRRERHRTRSTHPRGANDRWLVSYADFITLLFAFFTTMYAASSVDARKLETMVEAMQQAFDTEVMEPGRAAIPRDVVADVGADAPARGTPVATMMATDAMPEQPPVPIDAARYEMAPIPAPTSGRVAAGAVVAVQTEDPGDRVPSDRTLSHVLATLSEQLATEIVRGAVTLEMDRRGLVVSIRESGTFEVGSADLSTAAQRLMSRLAMPLVGIPNPIRIEGHTDNVPIHTARYGSNWDLSTTRAVNVVAFLVQDIGLEPARLSAAGYSEFHPRFPNDSAVNRARNRRVDMIILDPDVSRAEEPRSVEALDD